MASYHTIKQKNPSSEGVTATDFHVTTFDPGNPPDRTKTPKLNVKGFNGVKPDDPGASYSVDGDGSDEIDITDINIGSGGEANIRLQGADNKFPKVWVQWTAHNKPIGGPIEVSPEVAVSRVATPETIAALHQIVSLASTTIKAIAPAD